MQRTALKVRVKECVGTLPSDGFNQSGVCQYLYDHPEGLDSPFEDTLYTHVPSCKNFSSVVAKAGDVFITHGLLPHTNGQNLLHYARVITNPHVNLIEPFNLSREDGDYVSYRPVELIEIANVSGNRPYVRKLFFVR